MGEIVHNARQKNNPTMHSGFMLNGAKSSVEHRKETVVRPAILTKNADLNFEQELEEEVVDVNTEKMSS